ncbi:ABC transporter permease [Pseudovibrio sp. Tun.PSC04-5.I4]|uniref:MlaE family ABC transporter permease n=1 Tax=Pseudovibrio sp. Tun.PSC04-5.I4 TaxID=1798213 RepID=UPI00088E527D|nr:ABC transporter permease [Pseudovibrio sp. Tun.PSC04-5.I4]SDR36804.1 phospholipid/cholesterol/gamma-HCH transport system permease protein [Pseudovibrio sp. Tun.PSC04-5.I4]
MNLTEQMEAPGLITKEDGASLLVTVSGAWSIRQGATCEKLINEAASNLSKSAIHVDLKAVSFLDTAGAWLLQRFQIEQTEQGRSVKFLYEDARYDILLKEVDRREVDNPTIEPRSNSIVNYLESTGEATRQLGRDIRDVLAMLGELTATITAATTHPRRLRPLSIAVQFQRTCMGAVPIVCLMSFLIGGIIAQQGGFYLKQFGAEIFVVDLTGILVLREIGVILTAIMVAGRSGSAFTAELGSMKMREEIDALQVTGLRVTEVLILPRLVALMMALPILVFLANLSALAGAGLTCWWYLDIVPDSYVTQLQAAVTLDTLMVGIIKAPFMALIIGLIACMEGMKVEGSAESLGRHTTVSVVKSIFMVIVVDGIFAVFFASIGF